MKIGITCYPTYGGSGVVATELGIELAARGHQVHFITSSQPFRLTGREANIHFHQVEVYHYPLFELAPRGRHLPFITTLHGTDITLVGQDRSYLPITRFGITQSDGVTAISSHLRDRTREAFSIDSEIEVIRNFVNCDVYVRNPDLVAQMRPQFADPGEKLLVHLSNFRPVKRILDVVETFARVARAVPSRLLLIGDGPDRSAAEHLALHHGIQDRIHFLG